MSNGKIVLEDSAVEFLQEEIGGGGGSYTAGNGITITEENVINADVKVVVYKGLLSSIPSSILESLNGGDVLYAGNAYLVTEKNQFDIIITKVGQNGVDIWTYEKNGDRYECLSQEQRNIPLYSDPAYLNGDEGDIYWGIYDSIDYLGYCMTKYGMAISIGWDEEEDTIKLSTVVQDNKYYTVSFTINEPESEEEKPTYSFAITEHTLSNGGGIEFVSIDIDDASINQETLNKLVDFNNQTLKPNFIVLTTKSETDTFPILMPSDNLQYIYRSTVSDGKYYQLSLHIYEEPTGANIDIEQISVGGGVPIEGFSIFNYSTNAQLEPGQWNNQTMLEACQTSICFIGGPHTSKAFVSYADYSSNTYTFKLTGSTIEPGQPSGFGWDQEKQRFFQAGDPR